jgi:hypothetical protein
MRPIGKSELVVIMGAFAMFVIVPFWMIFRKAGYPGVVSFVMAVPFLNILGLFFLAFSDWPVLKELRALRLRAADQTGKFSGTL